MTEPLAAPGGAIVVLTTIPTEDEARRLARHLVESRQAACVQILPPQTSIYRWQGTVEESTERLMIIKTTASLYPLLERTIRDLHPYEVPEILALPVLAGAPDYLDWLRGEVEAPPG
jgi:periplasmic divalent cation tolerance protein